MIYAGIDSGSRTIKIVLIEKSGKIIAEALTDQGIEQCRLADQLLGRLLDDNQLNRKSIAKIIATGYGRGLIDFADTTVTEITCHAVGVKRLCPQVHTIIDIGGQDSKIIRLDEKGKVRDFAMNDRCAAGTGRFLEVAASRLGVCIRNMGELSTKSIKPAVISSMCVVFAETEMIGLLAQSRQPQDIAAGVQQAIASRITSLCGHLICEPVVFTGGVAMISGMQQAIENAISQKIAICPRAQCSGALGAALLAMKNSDKQEM